jgi:hypothetical protein
MAVLPVARCDSINIYHNLTVSELLQTHALVISPVYLSWILKLGVFVGK